jgi:putative PIG3 family NAD(P)H quinone oxidoreductase
MTSYTMRAVVIAHPGGPDVLELREVPRPEPGRGEVLVKVHAAALNRADLLQREGRYPAPAGFPADIPGMEFAGEIVGAGAGAARWRTGDRVMAITGGGAYAEYVTVHEDTLMRIPDGLAFTDAAAVPEAFITAHDALMQAEMRPADTVLIHGVASGVGLAAVQVVRALGGAAFGTARSAAKLDAARAVGMDSGVVVSESLAELAPAVTAFTGGQGIDVVLDLLGGPYTAASVAVMGSRGRLMLIGTLAGTRGDLPLSTVLRHRITIRGTVLRSRTQAEKIAAARAFEKAILPLIERGSVVPVIDSVFPLDEVRAAHRRMESNKTAGKIVLKVVG